MTHVPSWESHTMDFTSLLLLATGVAIGLLIGVIRNRPALDAAAAEELELLKERVSTLEDELQPRRAALDF